MELGTHKVNSFTSSLAASPDAVRDPTIYHGRENPHEPTRVPVTALAVGGPGEIWFLAPNALRRYRQSDNTWEAFPPIDLCRGLDSDRSSLYVGHLMGNISLDGRFYYAADRLDSIDFKGRFPAGLGVEILNFQTGQWRSLPAAEGLPRENVHALAVSGKDLWLGGFAYVALVDPENGALRKFAYHNARTVSRIQVGGGFVWAQFDQHLYRASLAGLH